MDVLSDVVASLRIGRPHSALVSRRRPFGRRFPASEGAGFHVMLQGGCRLLVDQGQPIALGPGDIAFLPRGSAHTLVDDVNTPVANAEASLSHLPPQPFDGRSDTVMLCGAYLLDRKHSHPLIEELPDVIHLPARLGDRTALRTVVDVLGLELRETALGKQAMIAALLDALLVGILRAWFADREDQGSGWAASLRDPAVRTALDLIHSEPGAPWTVDSLAARTHLSRAVFAARFAALVGRPPIGYLTWWRMNLAARELRDSDATVATIAARTGYTSEFAFSHAFKREFHLAPGRYRLGAARAGEIIDDLRHE